MGNRKRQKQGLRKRLLNREAIRIDKPIFGHASSTGSLHVNRGMPCEDHSLSLYKDGAILLSVSDGHGDPACFRAGKGSELACLASKEALFSLYDRGSSSLKGSLKEAGLAIIERWRELVDEDIENDPFIDPAEEISSNKGEEKEAASTKFYQAYGKEVSHSSRRKPYGATLRVAFISKKNLYLFQIGDGGTYLFYEDGKGRMDKGLLDERLEKKKEEQGGSVTTSLCFDHPEEYMLYHQESLGEKGRKPVAVFLSSDGFSDASRYSRFGQGSNPATDLQKAILKAGQAEKEFFSEEMEQWVETISKEGKDEDDVSLSYCVYPKPANGLAPQLKKIIDFDSKRIEMEKAALRWGGSSGSFQANKRYYVNAGNRLKQLLDKSGREFEQTDPEEINTKIQKFAALDLELDELFKKTGIEKILSEWGGDLSLLENEGLIREYMDMRDEFRSFKSRLEERLASLDKKRGEEAKIEDPVVEMPIQEEGNDLPESSKEEKTLEEAKIDEDGNP